MSAQTTILTNMLPDDLLRAIGADHADEAVALTRLCDYINTLRTALEVADGVFNELDEIGHWPQDASDVFHGRPGSCPVEYDKPHCTVRLALYPQG